MIAVQTSGSGNTFLLAVAFFFRQWKVLSGSRNFLTSSGNALGYNKQHASFTKKFLQKHIVPAAVLPKSKPVSVTVVRPICADVPKIMMNKPRHAHSLNTRSNSTIRRHKTCSHSSNTSNSSPKVTAAKAPVVSAAKGEESVIRDPKEESSEKTPTETKSKNKGKGILVEEPKPIKKKQQVEMDEDHKLAARLRAEEQR
uniref:Uncharacterized protein n=1 Tax=Tanacetum cinerariifolium TaxID=118510 RepID=A0A6L2NGY6_TANCI|nr:hypothetical protein [Tanacetum cinerariifolium]